MACSGGEYAKGDAGIAARVISGSSTSSNLC